ncbi:MAG: diacylglycerol kinase [Campylobacter sp.]
MKPKYNFFSNTKYAIDGLKAMMGETSFRIEIAFILPLLIFSLFLPVSLEFHILLVVVLVGILITECINTAIENCVDMITKEFHQLAKIAKDTASTAVMLSITTAVLTWLVAFLQLFFNLS